MRKIGALRKVRAFGGWRMVVWCLLCVGLLWDCTQPADPCGVCESGKVCVEGKCRPLCGDEEFLCSGVCVNPRQDTKNCGVCGKACGARERCEGGRCVEECVGEGVARCEDRCVDTRQDAKHCGVCGKACEIGQRCEGGNCLCAGGLLGCGGDGCVDLTADARHCGACGKSCGTGEVCVAGSCFQGTCPASTA
ncbi:hypothetical protein L6R29_06190, partial [Myxococcota bacterium]|nr:hypothetical protein [Myxococcota bacterium]